MSYKNVEAVRSLANSELKKLFPSGDMAFSENVQRLIDNFGGEITDYNVLKTLPADCLAASVNNILKKEAKKPSHSRLVVLSEPFLMMKKASLLSTMRSAVSDILRDKNTDGADRQKAQEIGESFVLSINRVSLQS